MVGAEFRTDSVGTMDWLQATTQLTVRAYSNVERNVGFQEAEAITLEDVSRVSWEVDGTHELSVQTSWNRVPRFISKPISNEWTEYASASERHVLNGLFGEGLEDEARRLNQLIAIFAEDDEELSPDSVEAFACFILSNRPKYPSPGIFGDDDGQVGIQWRFPSSYSASEGDAEGEGLLCLEFVSPKQASYFIDLEGISREGEASLEEIVESIEPLAERLAWR